MLMLMGVSAPRYRQHRRRLNGLGGWADFIFGEGTAEEPADPNVIEYEAIAADEAADAAAATSTPVDWGMFDPRNWTSTPATVAKPPTADVPFDWAGGLTNALTAINQGFFPKPASATDVTVATTPVVVVSSSSPPWYKTPLGMVAIAAGALGALAYYNKTKKA